MGMMERETFMHQIDGWHVDGGREEAMALS